MFRWIFLVAVMLALASGVREASAQTTTTVTTTSTSTSLAVVWQTMQDSDCTALQAATGVTSGVVNCCTASGHGECERRENWGRLFVEFATFVVNTTGGYTSGGDLLNAAALAKLKIQNIVKMECQPTSAGHMVVPLLTTASGKRAPRFKLYNSGGSQTSNTATLANEVVECAVYGY